MYPSSAKQTTAKPKSYNSLNNKRTFFNSRAYTLIDALEMKELILAINKSLYHLLPASDRTCYQTLFFQFGHSIKMIQ